MQSTSHLSNIPDTSFIAGFTPPQNTVPLLVDAFNLSEPNLHTEEVHNTDIIMLRGPAVLEMEENKSIEINVDLEIVRPKECEIKYEGSNKSYRQAIADARKSAQNNFMTKRESMTLKNFCPQHENWNLWSKVMRNSVATLKFDAKQRNYLLGKLVSTMKDTLINH